MLLHPTIHSPKGWQATWQQVHMLRQALPFLRQPVKMVISALLLAAKATSVATRLQTHQARWPGLCGSNWEEEPQDVRVIFCLCTEVRTSKGKEVVRSATVRAYSHVEQWLNELYMVQWNQAVFSTRHKRLYRLDLHERDASTHKKCMIQSLWLKYYTQVKIKVEHGSTCILYCLFEFTIQYDQLQYYIDFITFLSRLIL